MTIAIGILATDGIVLAADQEETSAELKTAVAKIQSDGLHTQSGDLCVAISGSGDGDLLASIKGFVIGDIMDVPVPWSEKEIFSRFEARLLDYYSKHVLPFYVGVADPPEFDLVLGVERYGQGSLWASHHTAVRPSESWEAVGIGRLYAGSLLNRLWREPLGVRETAVLAAYIIFCVRKAVKGCGEGVHVACLVNGRCGYLSEAEVEALECSFENYVGIESKALNYLIGSSREQDLKEISKYLRATRKELARFITPQANRSGPKSPKGGRSRQPPSPG